MVQYFTSEDAVIPVAAFLTFPAHGSFLKRTHILAAF
jgi:hypothetical protein